jgi:cobalamin biosynthesis Mg chelatase CobN
VDTDSANVDDWKGTPTRVTATGQSSTASTASSTTPTAPPTTTPEPAPQSAAPTTTPQSPTPAPTATPQTSAPTTAPTAPSDTERPTGTSGRAASELPRTASPIPTVGLVGLLAVAGALFVRARRTGLI